MSGVAPWGDVSADAGALELQPAAWRVVDLAGAEWAMQRLRAAEAEMAVYRAQYDGWRAQLDGWLDEVTRKPAATAEFFRQHLETYALGVRAQSDDKVKTVKIPSGKIATRAGGTTLAITDPENLDQFVLSAMVVPSIDDGPVQLADLVTRRSIVKSQLQAELTIRQTQTGTRWTWPCDHWTEYPLDEWDARPAACPTCGELAPDDYTWVPHLLFVEEPVLAIVTGYGDDGEPITAEVVVPGLQVQHGEPSATVTPVKSELAPPEPFTLT